MHPDGPYALEKYLKPWDPSRLEELGALRLLPLGNADRTCSRITGSLRGLELWLCEDRPFTGLHQPYHARDNNADGCLPPRVWPHGPLDPP